MVTSETQQHSADAPAVMAGARVGTITQLNVSAGGVPKTAVSDGVVGPLGLEGDSHRGAGHGGPERALCLFSAETIARLQAEGHPIASGTVGENVTIAGLDWSLVTPGTRLRLGEAVLVEVTRYTTPCINIVASFIGGDFTRILQDKHPGESRVYVRVLEGGPLRTGDRVEVLVADAGDGTH